MSCRICAIPEESLIALTAWSKAFFPDTPVAPAHIVVAVREHRPLLDDLTDEEAADLLVTARRIAAAIRPLAGVEKFYTAAVGDVDLHYHLHLLPRAPGVGGLGPFIFGIEGWAGLELPKGVDAEGVQNDIRLRLRSTD